MSEHKPTYEDMEIAYGLDKHFRWWLQARESRIEAAAEQRGAEMVMDALKREASDHGWEGLVQPGRSLQELVDHIEHGIRADAIGGATSDDND